MSTTTFRDPAKWLMDFLSRNASDEGPVAVNENTMVGLGSIFYALTTIAGDVAKLNPDLKRRTDPRGAANVPAHPAWNLLRYTPNRYQSADIFREQVQLHALGWGNGRAAIVWDALMRPVELIPLMPDRTFTAMVNGEKYHVTDPGNDDALRVVEVDGVKISTPTMASMKNPIAIHDASVIHIQGFGWDGIQGVSLASLARHTIGADLRAAKFTVNQLKKGFSGKVMFEAPAGVFAGKFGEGDGQKFIEGIRQTFGTEHDSEIAGLLRDGIKANVLNMSNVDMQFLEQRKFSRQEVMLWFRLQHIPGDESSTSYAGKEQAQISYLTQCLDRWLVAWEMQLRKLLTEAEKAADQLFFKFNRGSLLRADTITTANALSTLVRATILSRNEARDKLDLNPVEGGDNFANPAITAKQDNTQESQRTNTEPGDMATSSRMKHMQGIEIQRVVDGAKKPDYIGYLQDFYAGFTLTLLDVAKAENVDARQVIDTMQSHQTDLAQCAARSKTKQELDTNIREIVKTWSA